MAKATRGFADFGALYPASSPLARMAPPPTLAEACEVIEALLKEWGPCDRIGADGCERARAFLARVKSGT